MILRLAPDLVAEPAVLEPAAAARLQPDFARVAAPAFGHHAAMAVGADDRFGNDRARLLAVLGGSLVHEVANRLGALVGLVEATASRRSDGEQEAIENAAAAARESVVILRRVVHLLERRPRSVAVTPLVAVVREAIALTARHGQRHGGAAFEFGNDGEPGVRADRAELLQVIATALLWAQRRAGANRIRVDVQRRTAGRPMATVRIGGVAGDFQRLAAALAGDVEQLVPGLFAASDGSDALVLAVAMLRRWGGDLAIDGGGAGAAALLVSLPEVR